MTILGTVRPSAPVPIARLAELTDGLGHDAGLLADLAGGGLQRALAGVDVALGQREHA